jgi:hypothetical protein
MALDRVALVHQLVTTLHGKMEQPKLDSAVATILKGDDTSYPTNGGTIVCALFYMRFWLYLCYEGNLWTFIGNAGGIGSIGAGALVDGNVYTNDIQRLLDTTSSFSFQISSGGGALQFFDGSSNFLGAWAGPGVGICNGVGGGSGSWTQSGQC